MAFVILSEANDLLTPAINIINLPEARFRQDLALDLMVDTMHPLLVRGANLFPVCQV